MQLLFIIAVVCVSASGSGLFAAYDIKRTAYGVLNIQVTQDINVLFTFSWYWDITLGAKMEINWRKTSSKSGVKQNQAHWRLPVSPLLLQLRSMMRASLQERV